MFKFNMIVAARHFMKNKIGSGINVLGLGVGIACCMLAFFFIQDEYTFDSFHKNLHRIYGVKLSPGQLRSGDVSETQPPLGPVLKKKFPEVVMAVRVTGENIIILCGERVFEETGIAADPGFFQLFTFPFLQGEQRGEDLDSIVLSRRLAEKVFGPADPLGNVLHIKIKGIPRDFIVTGVMEDIPHNSSMHFDFVLPFGRIYRGSMNDWEGAPSIPCFVLLEKGIRPEMLEEKFTTTVDRFIRQEDSGGRGYRLYAFSEYHLGGNWDSPVLTKKSDKGYSLMVGVISLLVLLIACFNFTNLTVGNASSRLKEIGIRKAMGAHRMQLFKQFWFESIFFGLLALAAGMVFVELFLPVFRGLSPRNMYLSFFGKGAVPIMLLGIVLFVGTVGGCYPAAVLSGISSSELLRGDLKMSGKKTFSRVLVVFQFSISIFLLIASVFLSLQKNLMVRKDLGYDPNRVVVIPLEHLESGTQKNQWIFPHLKEKLRDSKTVANVSASSCSMSSAWTTQYFTAGVGEKVEVAFSIVDPCFLQTLGIHLVGGRNFFPNEGAESVIINQAFVKKLGIESPVGRPLSDFIQAGSRKKIIGVVEDFHFQSLHKRILPAFLFPRENAPFKYIFIKLKKEDFPDSLPVVRAAFKGLFPDMPFIFSFLDDEVKGMYSNEVRWSRTVSYASLFATLIACSGLFGLTLLIVVLKAKEIGIRKILGASVPGILRLINKKFIGLVILSNLIAWPAAYWTISMILRNYAYRIPLVLWVFTAAGLAALITAFISISVQALKTAVRNPAEALKCE